MPTHQFFGQGQIDSNDHSYDDQEEEEEEDGESSSEEMAQVKQLPFSKLARSPVRWSDLGKKRAVSPIIE